MNHLKKEVKLNYRISGLEDTLEMHHGIKALNFIRWNHLSQRTSVTAPSYTASPNKAMRAKMQLSQSTQCTASFPGASHMEAANSQGHSTMIGLHKDSIKNKKLFLLYSGVLEAEISYYLLKSLVWIPQTLRKWEKYAAAVCKILNYQGQIGHLFPAPFDLSPWASVMEEDEMKNL